MDPEPSKLDGAKSVSPFRVLGWICAGVIGVAVLACVLLASSRSEGLSRVTVIAQKDTDEPRDHQIPFIKQKEALPDYELVIVCRRGTNERLGMKPDRSARDGLTWTLREPISINDIASVRLQDRDKVLSDVVAEVEFTKGPATDSGFDFQFETVQSSKVGIDSFFDTPIGKAISGAFFIAVLLMLLAALGPAFGA